MHAELPFDPDAPAPAGSLFGLPFGPEQAALHLFPVPWQATTSFRRGTRAGPKAMLEASTQVDLFDVEYSDFWRAGIYLHPEDPEIVSWDTEAEPLALGVIAALTEGEEAPDEEALDRVNELGRLLNEKVYEQTRALLADGRIPAVLGGDHSVPFGAIQAVAERHPGMGILHIDAHADLRDAYEGFTWSHASIFHNVLHHIP
ncbi:MAG TPA: arginase family protein, partial [Myxococcota bacterium]|nr:arginase family protein [Myxococcota bacterium]